MKSNEHLNSLRDMLGKMPPCLEKHIISLIFHANLKVLDASTIKDQLIDSETFENLDEIIKQQFDLFEQRLRIEHVDADLSIEGIRCKINLQDWLSVVKDLNKLLKAHRPLNISELRILIENAKKVASQIKNQDIILFLGGTGSGKSTAIHFVAGSKMAMTNVEIEKGIILQHIAPVEPYHTPALYNVSVSSKAESETRYISAVPVHPDQNSSIILCDSPGFGDTAGPEVDIANGLGIVEAVKGCKSVKPVILISYLMVGDRGEGIKKLAHLLVKMVSNISDKLSCFSYIFTKYPANVDIHASLLNIKQTSIDKNPEERSDTNFMAVFDDLLEKTEDGALRLDPLKDKPRSFLRKLIDSASIHNPQEVFNFSVTENSRNAMQEQVRMHQVSIIDACKRSEYDLIKYKLDDLLFLRDTLKEDFVGNIFNECLQCVINSVYDLYKDSVDAFNRCFDSQNKLSVEDITKYKQIIDKFRGLECLQSYESIPNPAEAMRQNLRSKSDKYIVAATSFDLNMSVALKTMLDNLKLLATSFTDLHSKYQGICQVLDDKVKAVDSDLGTNLQANDFIRVANDLDVIKFSLIHFKEHLNVSDLYKTAVERLKHHLGLVSEGACQILKEMSGTSGINALESLKTNIKILENAMETAELRRHIEKVALEETFETVAIRITSHFRNLDAKISGLLALRRDDCFKKVEPLVLEMDMWRSISVICARTSEIYQSAMQNILGLMQQLKRDVRSLLADEIHTDEAMSELVRQVTSLRNAYWMQRIKPDIYDEIMLEIKENLLEQAKLLRESVGYLDVCLENSSNIKSAYTHVKYLEKIGSLDETVAEISAEESTRFFNQIEKQFDFIQTSFNLEKQSVCEHERQLDEFERLRAQYDTFNISHSYLVDKGFASEEMLLSEIEQLRLGIEGREKNGFHLERRYNLTYGI